MEDDDNEKNKTCSSPVFLDKKHNEVRHNDSSAATENDFALSDRKVNTAGTSCSDDDSSSKLKKRKLESDGSAIDSAETIKKIQAFIALGKSDDKSIAPESLAKRDVANRPTDNLDVIESNSKGNSNNKMNITQLHQTLIGLDDSQDNTNGTEIRRKYKIPNRSENKFRNSSAIKYKNSINMSSGPTKTPECNIPSRVSKRIQNKSVKFSVKKMLGEDDSSGYDEEDDHDEAPPKREAKAVKANVKKTSKDSSRPDKTMPCGPEKGGNETKNNEESDKPVSVGIIVSNIPANLSSPPKYKSRSVSPESPESSPLKPSGQRPKNAISDKLTKLTVSNKRVARESQTGQEKKVVRIVVPPSLPKASLGPDIIIKRVKPVKKTVVLTENKVPRKSIIEKEIELRPNHATVAKAVKLAQNVSNASGPVNSLGDAADKKMSPESRVGDSQSNSVKVVDLHALSEAIKGADKDEQMPPEIPEDRPKGLRPDEATNCVSKRDRVIDQNGLPHGKANEPVKKALDKSTKGRKPLSKAALTPVVKTKDVKKTKSPEEIIIEEEDTSGLGNGFDKYFTTSERLIEHHDSLDSDSDLELDSDIYSHFVNLRHHIDKRKRRRGEEASVYDLMQDISIELPTWNIHASSNGDIFYLVQVDTKDDLPCMKKVVEIDEEFNAKVYIDNKEVPVFFGKYSSYEDIRHLIYDVEQL